MKYDDAEYCFLNFETDLPNEAGGTHTGMYLAWAALRGLLGPSFADARFQAQVARLLAREITGSELYFDACDGKLTSDDFNAQGNAFTAWYYEKHFTRDYERVFQAQIPDTGHPTDDFCSVADTWANCDRLARALDQRFAQWQATLGGAPPSGGTVAPQPRTPLALVEDSKPATVNTPPPAAQTKTPAPPKTPAPRKAPQDSSTPSFKPHAGHAALLIGAAAFLILLALATSLTGTPLKALAVALAIIGAFGVYRCSTDLEIPVLGKVFLTAVALLPIAGSFVCIMVLLWLVRRWQEPS